MIMKAGWHCYRVCMQRVGLDTFDADSVKHHFLSVGTADHPQLARMKKHEH